MKTARRRAILGCVLCVAAGNALAADWFVATNGNDAAEGTNWATAKLTIQAAIDAAAANDRVWVSNGVYAAGGGRAGAGTWLNRVAIDKPVVVESVAGPATTFIVGDGMRGVYVTNGAVLSGFTVANGTTQGGMCGMPETDNPDHYGGGVLCGDGAVVNNCILTGNWACYAGGGSSGGILNDCILSGNRCDYAGGGSHNGTLNDCVLTNNSSLEWGGAGAWHGTLNRCVLTDNRGGNAGGGACEATLNGCIVKHNRADSLGGGAYGSTLNNCLLTGNTCSLNGGGSHGGTLINCTVVSNAVYEEWGDSSRGGGSYGGALDNCVVYGNTSGGTDPNWSGGTFSNSCTTPMPTGSGNIASDPLFVDAGAGNYRLGTNSPCINGGDNAWVQGDVDLDGNPRIAFGADLGRVDMGAYEFLSKAWYAETGGSDAAAGTNWATAKATIQAAIDETVLSDMVWVSNGVYATGGRTVGPGALTNRVAIDRPIVVRSVNGPEATVIQGAGPSGAASVRCAYVGSNAVLSGFTLTNGMATPEHGADNIDRSGGGVFLAAAGLVEHCLISGNYAKFGAGAYLDSGGRLDGCRMIGNSAGDTGVGGGAYGSGGGRLDNCLIAENYAEWAPGVDGTGGGMELINCTLSGNSSFGGPAVVAPTSTLRNCIVFSNNVDPDHFEIEGDPVVVHSCSPGLTGGGNVTNDPQFVDAAAGNYRLQAISPCLDAGAEDSVAWAEDLDGNPRIAFGAVDMGAYEAQLAGAGTWFGAITNGQSGDLDCVAGDGVPNLLKYAMGGSPRISDDRMLLGCLPAGAGPALTFCRNPHATDVRFVVESADRLTNGAAWRGLATNLNGSWGGAANVEESGTGNPVACTVTDPVALASNRFLRLRVTRP